MGSVTFTPHYTLRALSSGPDSTLNIRYHARISNTSGEDWNDVSLAISTAQASETTVIPQMMRWTVDFTSATGNYYLRNAKTKSTNFNIMPQRQQQMLYASAFAPGAPVGRGGSFGGQTLEED